ncbi:N-acetyltransferase 9-like protein isoform X3 [Dreissena polymorpha]|uniref:N-acetyltransferase domain-containing protein n=2 Tax=Dreissena polymorpha TaxID=45954 RepID=A0A9D4RCL7_DREPO|nr:N-acetyltransferase 9-like protein isoform X3 [Dreissena polymorpha]XP_052263137.1 N-acetyltransferase 9-like protein isoform X3 [Dreissena polymorpha]KAH3863476.1 hypothetical protein DPMN_026465 [Dreissena polymorpha]
MKSEELQTLTASEPLSLEQEYEMQQAWRNDENKCTFIVLDKSKYHGSVSTEIESMVGDVNLFFNEADDNTTAEIEIMIAEPLARGRGFGKEALLCMMIFGFEELSIRRYTAKIGYSNETSLKMFSKLGFTEVSRSEVFKEVTLELRVMDSVIADFLQGSELYCHEEYTHT